MALQNACRLVALVLLGTGLGPMPVLAQEARSTEAAPLRGVDAANRPVRAVRVVGVGGPLKQLVLNQIRVQAGQPYDPDAVARDIQNVTRLGRFSAVTAQIEPHDDGTVTLIYAVKEQPILADVQVVGNKNIADRELLDSIIIRPGDPEDDFLIERGREQLVKQYREQGYYLADISVDRQTLRESSVLIYKIREGPRVKVRKVEFQGNATFTAKQLQSKIRTRKHVFIFEKGQLSDEQLEEDVTRLTNFYRERGYLDARVGRRVQLSDDRKDATVVFFVEEGVQYVVGDIVFEAEAAKVFSEEQLRDALALKTGDVFSVDKVRAAQKSLEDLYGRLGYLPVEQRGRTAVRIQRVFLEDSPRVNLRVGIEQGKPYTVGNVQVVGNRVTQDKVVRRQLRGLEPGRRFDRVGLQHSERRLNESSLFQEAKITVLGEADRDVRDVLVEVRERRTGEISLGAAISSDSGLLGAFDVKQRNFDITDWPESWSEFVSGQAFRGAGQYFAISVQPGDRVSRYSVNFREPYMWDSDYFLDTSLFFYSRDYEDDEGSYDESRYGGSLGIGKRFGDVWSGTVRARLEQVEIRDIDPAAPVDVFAERGTNQLGTLGFSLARNTTDSRIFPTRGSVLRFGIDQAGAFGGDFDYTTATADLTSFFTVDEDFFGRKTVLSINLKTGYIFQDAPVFERYYAGGHSSFRGFRYRGIGPRGIRNDTGQPGDDPVGGDFLFLAGAQYNFPLFKEMVRGVFFVDSGTVDTEIDLSRYRLSVGTGVRLMLPMLGNAPFAFDFAFPVLREDTDQERIFSFSVDLPF